MFQLSVVECTVRGVGYHTILFCFFTLLNWFKPSSKIFYWPFQGGTSFVDLLCFCSVLCLLCLCCASVYICFVVTCWENADLLASFEVSNCAFVTFPLVSWVRCGAWLYRFLIFAPLLTLFDWSDSLRPNKQFFCYVGTGFPGLNQY